jgi:hypothetical protein
MLRKVVPELLDELPPDDLRAIHSRDDLRRVNKLMGNAEIMARAIRGARGARGASGASAAPSALNAAVAPFAPLAPLAPVAPNAPRLSIVELGGGDGTFLLELAKRVARTHGPAHVTLVDQQTLLTSNTRNLLSQLSWQVDAVKADVFEWLGQRGSNVADVTLANLFLHHFEGDRLSTLLREASRQTRMFVACEPRRSGAALAAASMMGLIGCNSVTVHDARISVRAGFRDHELSKIWPTGNGWTVEEEKAGRFTHGFVARLTHG